MLALAQTKIFCLLNQDKSLCESKKIRPGSDFFQPALFGRKTLVKIHIIRIIKERLFRKTLSWFTKNDVVE